MLRLFFALQPTSEVGAELAERAAPLVTQLQGQPVPSGNLHATLCFVGAVAPERLDALRAAAASLRATRGELFFDALEYWDKAHALVVSMPGRESREALALADALRGAAVAAGFSPDAKPFRAHLTLGRKIPHSEARKFAWPREFSPGFVVPFDRFVLMESRRGEHGSIYSVVESWPLYERV
jgi:2'-5' RNA ligase